MVGLNSTPDLPISETSFLTLVLLSKFENPPRGHYEKLKILAWPAAAQLQTSWLYFPQHFVTGRSSGKNQRTERSETDVRADIRFLRLRVTISAENVWTEYLFYNLSGSLVEVIGPNQVKLKMCHSIT